MKHYSLDIHKLRGDMIADHYSIIKCATKTGYHESTIRKWLDGTVSPKLEDYLSLCSYLGLDPKDYISVRP